MITAMPYKLTAIINQFLNELSCFHIIKKAVTIAKV